MSTRLLTASLLLALSCPLPADAWGHRGHRYIGVVAARNFPAAIPAFLRGPDAVRRIGEMAREPDRSRNAGNPHDSDLDPGHFVNVLDDGTIRGGPKLGALPDDREAYDTALRAAGSDEYKAGFLPYAIIDGWQQLVKDFTLWRADVAGAKFAKTRADREWFLFDRRTREILTLRDLGYWSHFVGDASQPMHVSIHYNGWGDGPNPQGFETAAGLHAKFETAFIDAHVAQADVAAAMRPYKSCACTIRQRVTDYLVATNALVGQTYQFEKDGAYKTPTAQSTAFAAGRIAEGAAMLRDLTADAWQESANAVIGYNTKLPMADIEAGKSDPATLMREMRD